MRDSGDGAHPPPPVNGVPPIRTGLFIGRVRSSVAGAAERGQVSEGGPLPAGARAPLAALAAHFTHVTAAGGSGGKQRFSGAQ